MSAIMTIDDGEARGYMTLLKRFGAKLANKVARRTVNNTAYHAKLNSTDTMAKVFKYKNAGAKRWTEKGVSYDKAKESETQGNFTARVGALGDPSSTTHKGQRTSYLRRQEEGGKAAQLKSAGGLFRKRLQVTPDPTHNKAEQTPRLKGTSVGVDQNLAKLYQKRSSRFVRRLKFRTRDRILFASALAAARQLGKRYAITPYGVYRVGKRMAIRMQVFRKSITTPAHPWLKPATDKALQNQPEYFKEAMRFTLKEAGFSA